MSIIKPLSFWQLDLFKNHVLEMLLIMIIIAGSFKCQGKTTVWNSSSSGNWSNDFNWDNGAPENGDVVFFTSFANGNSNQDIPNLVLNEINMSFAGAYIGILNIEENLVVNGTAIISAFPTQLYANLTVHGANSTFTGGISTESNILNITAITGQTTFVNSASAGSSGSILVANDLVINERLIVLGNVNVEGNLSGAGGSMVGLGDFTIAGTSVDLSGINVDMTEGEFKLDGIGNVTIINDASDAFYDFISNSSSVVSVSSTLLVKRDLLCTGSLSLASGGANIGRDLSVSSGNLVGGGGTVFVFRNVDLTGANSVDFTTSHTLLNLNGNVSQTVTQSGLAFGAITVNNTGNATPVVVWNDGIAAGKLILQDGAVFLANGGQVDDLIVTQPLILAGTLKTSGDVTFIGNMTFASSGSSNLEFNSNTNQNFDPGGQSFDRIEINNAGSTVTLESGLSASALNITSGTFNTNFQSVVLP